MHADSFVKKKKKTFKKANHLWQNVIQRHDLYLCFSILVQNSHAIMCLDRTQYYRTLKHNLLSYDTTDIIRSNIFILAYI